MTQTASTEFPALDSDPIDKLAIDTIRTLAWTQFRRPTPVSGTLWLWRRDLHGCQKFLRFDPAEPIWSNRYRFILSAGHASTLLYPCCISPGLSRSTPQYEAPGSPA